MKLPNIGKIKIAIFIIPIICSLLFLIVKIVMPQTYVQIIQDDSIIENSQFFLFLSSSIFAFIISRRFIHNRFILHGIMYFILFIGLLFISMEEISWGQRIFNIETPRYFAIHNMQQEITIHNLEFVQHYLLGKAYILIGLYGTFAWLLMRMVKIRNNHIIRFAVPEWFISPYFWPVLFVYSYFDYISRFGVHVLGIDTFRVGVFVIYRDQEPAELLLSLGLLIFMTVNNIKSKKMCLENESTRTS